MFEIIDTVKIIMQKKLIKKKTGLCKKTEIFYLVIVLVKDLFCHSDNEMYFYLKKIVL